LLQKDAFQLTQNAAAAGVSADYKWCFMQADQRIHHTDYNFSWILDPNLIGQVGLRPGDQILYTTSDQDKEVTILEINNLPINPPLPRGFGDYPNQRIPLDEWGFFSLRVMTSRAPWGFGQCVYVVSPGRVGKTSLLFEVWESLLRLTKRIPSLFVIMLLIGERQKDAKRYEAIKDATPHDPKRVEFYAAPVTDEQQLIKDPAELIRVLQGQWRLFDYITTQRQPAVSRHYHGTLLTDALHRAAAAFSFGNFGSTDGLMGGGVRTESLFESTNRVAHTGNWGETSSSTVNVLLGNYSRGDDPSVLVGIFRETGDNVPDSTWTLVNNPAIGYPKVDVDELRTSTRNMEQFATIEQIEEHRALTRGMFPRTAAGEKAEATAEQAHAFLLNYCRAYQIPKWASNPPEQPITPYHLQLLNLNVPIDRLAAYLTDAKETQRIEALATSRGISAEQVMRNALELYFRATEAETQGNRVFFGPKPGDEIFQVSLSPRISPQRLDQS
jgi:hypothetical protein